MIISILRYYNMRPFILLIITMKIVLLLLISLTNPAIGGGKLSVYFDQNGIERQMVWQCSEIEDCFDIIQNRIEERGECDSKVNRVVLERVHIDGLDD